MIEASNDLGRGPRASDQPKAIHPTQDRESVLGMACLCLQGDREFTSEYRATDTHVIVSAGVRCAVVLTGTGPCCSAPDIP